MTENNETKGAVLKLMLIFETEVTNLRYKLHGLLQNLATFAIERHWLVLFALYLYPFKETYNL